MTFFTKEEFENKYNQEVENWQIENACEMIYSQVGLRYREQWNETNVPSPIKNASMEQLRFLIEHDIPFVDSNKMKQGGMMEVDLNSDISTLAQRMLGNAGYLYRGNPINANMGITIPFGD